MRIIHGDCLEELRKLEADSVDSMVTDPPYGLSKEPDIAEVMGHWIARTSYAHTSKGFMGKSWDSFVPGPEYWRECYRVLKPGSHGLVFAGTRTQDLMSVSLRFAGFEIRETIMWLHGQGFPKSHNISKAIDKLAGAEREVVGEKNKLQSYGYTGNNCYGSDIDRKGIQQITTSTTLEARKYEGWGSALKPSYEPVILVRKPLSEESLAKNVLKHGTGGINIDASRIAHDGRRSPLGADGIVHGEHKESTFDVNQGRFPANLLLSHNEDCVDEHYVEDSVYPPQCTPGCAVAMLDAQSGNLGKSIGGNSTNIGSNISFTTDYSKSEKKGKPCGFGDSGGASRFFYCAKTSKSERNKGIDSADLIWEREAWLRPDLSSLTESISLHLRDISVDTTMGSKSWSTDLYGHIISEQYPKGLIFTIETVLKLITELKTLNSFQSSSTNENIQDAIKTIEKNGLSLAASAEFINKLNLNSIREETAYLLGVVRAVLPTLLSIKDFAKSANFHPTCKPQKLMSYLITMITPPGGTCIDPFLGSGSTGCAAVKAGFNFIGIEKELDYIQIAQARIRGNS